MFPRSVSVCLLFLLAILAAANRGDAQQPAARPPAVEELLRKPGDGEQCLVCGKPITDGEVVELRYRGRRFHVAAPMLAELLEQPDRYFHKLQARSALFDEESNARPRPTSGWLYTGLYVLAGLVCGALCGYLAISRGLAPLPWFFAGLAGNVAALAVIGFTRRGDASAAPAGIPSGLAKVPTTRRPQPCPSCGETNHPAARACAHCRGALEPVVRSEVTALTGGKP